MMIYRQVPLYRFVSYCNQTDLDKNVLDCGAGGFSPPLGMFLEFGYKVQGIEFEESQIRNAEEFSKQHKINLNIKKGDIRKIELEDNSMSFVYSYNTIFHLKKEDIQKSIEEIKRITKPGGLIFVNFLSTDDQGYGIGKALSASEFEQSENEETFIHSYYEHSEADKYFEGMEILFKEIRSLERLYNGKKIKQGYIDYIIKK